MNHYGLWTHLPHDRPDREAEGYEGGQDEDGVKHRQHDQQLLYRLLQWKLSARDKLIFNASSSRQLLRMTEIIIADMRG